MVRVPALNEFSPQTIDAETKARLRVLLIAKNAFWTGSLHPVDGNHALYHREMREVLEAIGFNLVISDRFEVLFDDPEVDFVFPLLNRAGFFNSEMLGPLLCERNSIPYLGASPILRGLSDDKHLAKRAAAFAGVPTAPWAIYRRGSPIDLTLVPLAVRYVIKPNASSASWGVSDAIDLDGVKDAVCKIHALGHDALVEPFIDGSDVEVPVITVNGEPQILPMMIFRQGDPSLLRTYQEKRDLIDRSQKYALEEFDDRELNERISEFTRQAWQEYRPFDYGRFEFRVNEETGEISFLELNLNCNLWSKKVFGRAASLAGWSQLELIETIVSESLCRHGLLTT